jgi:hypothetical protein
MSFIGIIIIEMICKTVTEFVFQGNIQHNLCVR